MKHFETLFSNDIFSVHSFNLFLGYVPQEYPGTNQNVGNTEAIFDLPRIISPAEHKMILSIIGRQKKWMRNGYWVKLTKSKF